MRNKIFGIRVFNRIKAQDITLVQTDWLNGPDDYSHVWTATYYGEPVGKATYSYLRETWQLTGQVYCEKPVLLDEVYMHKDKFDYGQEELTKEEVKELRRCRKILSKYLNKQNYGLH